MINVKVNRQTVKLLHFTFIILHFTFILTSCSLSKQISKQAHTILLNDTAISRGHIGISIYEPATNTYWYNYNADKYFIPSSNTKLFTLYAGMKYLGDSLAGLRYQNIHDTVYALPTGDPTFMHADFNRQPVADFFKTVHSIIIFSDQHWKAEKYGKGWAWDDHNEDYMPERSVMPVHGNVSRTGPSLQKNIPFVTNGIESALDSLHTRFPLIQSRPVKFNTQHLTFNTVFSQPSDSLFKPMMHNSDNFFAEQTLLMISNEKLGYMSDEMIIDTLLKTDLKDVPHKPKWVDGSGLSRYNLFTPRSFVYILDKMKNEFGLDRLKVILPTGGQGRLKSYFSIDSSFVYAKTGTLSNNSSLSGLLITGKGKLLIFSILANNYPTGATPVRRAVELFLHRIREKY